MIPKVKLTQLNSVTAATAWKEFAHNKEYAKKFAKAGLFKDYNIQSVSKKASDKTNIPVINYRDKPPALYIDQDRANQLNTKKALMKEFYLKTGLKDTDPTGFQPMPQFSFIQYSDKGLAKDLAGIPNTNISKESLPKLRANAIMHEVLENVYSKQDKVSRNSQLLKQKHNNYGVLVQGRRVFNQTGGSLTNKPRKGLLDEYYIRDFTNENPIIDSALPNKPRLKSIDYKKAIRSLNKRFPNEL